MYLIDGNNLIGAVKREYVGTPESRVWLIEVLREFQKKKRSKIVLFLDGPRDPELLYLCEKIEVVFSEDRDADELIIERIKKIHYRRDLELITRDGELKRFAKSKGVKVKDPSRFFRFVLNYINNGEVKKPPPESLTQKEIELWEEIMKKKKK